MFFLHPFFNRFFQFILIFICAIISLKEWGEAKIPNIQDLSIEEKVGQLLMVHFHGSQANAEARLLIEKAYVGGFIYYQWANALTDPYQIQALSAGLQQLAKKQPSSIPLLIAIDQEGGVVNRLKNFFTVFPGNYALTQTCQPELAEASAFAIGQELKAVGINMNLAPVIDVNSNPLNPIIGIRAFSDHPEQVAKFGQKALRGYQRASMIAVLKHFPGHGDVVIDSHERLPIVNKTLTDLEKIELFPFKQLIPNADVIMTAHILVPNLDSKKCATLSPAILQGLLRKQLGFKGLIMTDSLVMQGLLDSCQDIEEAVIQSVEAGNDIILLGGKQLHQQDGLELTSDKILEIHHALVNAVKKGRITEERLNQSVHKILNLKATYHLEDKQVNSDDISTWVANRDHQELAQEIAFRALTVISSNEQISSLAKSQMAFFAPEIVRPEIEQTSALKIGNANEIFYFKDLNPTEAECENCLCIAKKADILVFFSYNAWKNKKQLDLMNQLQKLGKQSIIIVIRDPQDVDFISGANLVMCTFSPVTVSIQAAIDRLKGEK